MRGLLFLLTASLAWAQKETAAGLMAKAAAAFEANQLQEKHWNWTTTERREVVGKDGRVLESLPAVTVESVIRADGRRCAAVLAWGDGVEPYALTADADTRCADQEQLRSPLRIEALLRSTRVKLLSRTAEAIAIAIQPNKSLLHSSDEDVRCTASTRAVVKLDPASFFPVRVEGEVVESGCEGEVNPVMHYGEDPLTRPARRMLRKGTAFRLDYALQADRFGHPENSFWISVSQHWSRPFAARAAALVMFGRRFDLDPNIGDRRMIVDVQTVAREFGVASETRFETIPK
ncbi:MAG TPA: hypothetical protein VGF59_23630 [Bryobacteraceae bacterium]|jgi:hypothetical protein